MIKTISLDLETYSSVDITKCGVYRYAESPDFEILLLSYSIDEGEIHTIDLAQGEQIPEDILEALVSENVQHWAFNSSFERICLSVWLRKNRPALFKGYGKEVESTQLYLSPSSWYCDLVLSAYSGLPLSLKGVGAVLKLDEQKDEKGKALIKYFCAPCSPTLSNEGRARNYYYNDILRWEEFKEYNKQDVKAETAIHSRLIKYNLPEFLWDEYHVSETINDRGIKVDMDLVRGAIAIDKETREDLTQKLSSLTLLDNPNSVSQMKEWLKENGVNMETLGKKTVESAIKDESLAPDVKEILKLRLQLAKSSIRKYDAIESCVCRDGRVHGMFMFYGANRSGRYSSRIIQIQNLVKNQIEDLENAREIVKLKDSSILESFFDDVPDTLSQLIRTAFVPREGYKFIVADYSAIEARVIAYMANEQWRIDAFARGDDIYCAAASEMFGVPVVKHGINSELRQRGKIGELACIAEGQLVLTDRGLVPIEEVTIDDKVWDGEEWVNHDGVIYKGEREVITYEGLTATEEHLVWVEGKNGPLRFEEAAKHSLNLVKVGEKITYSTGWEKEGIRKVYDILNAGPHHRFTVSGKLVHNCGYGGGVGALKAMGALDMGLKEEDLKPLVDSWREASPNIVKFWWNVDEAVKRAIKDRTETETNGLLFEYRSGMLFITLPSGRHLSYVKPKIETNQWGGESVTYEGVGTTKKWERIESYGPKFVENCLAAGTKVVTNKGLVPIEEITSDMLIWDGIEYVHHEGLIYQGEKAFITVSGIEMTPEHKILTDKGWKKAQESAGLIWAGTKLKVSIYPSSDIKSVYDIRNCGPRHRFAVWNGEAALIVSNCVQAVSRDILCAAMTRMQNAGISTVAHIHDETVNEVPMDTKIDEITSLMSISPEWMKDIKLNAEGYECSFYMKS